MKKPLLVTLLILGSLAGALRAENAAVSDSRVALSGDGSALSFQLESAGGAVSLSLSMPNGEVVRREFAPGAKVALSLFDAKGQALADGAYTWELVAAPGARAVRERANGSQDAVAGGWTASGSFRIIGGTAYFQGVEPRPARAAEKAAKAPSVGTRDQVIADDLIVQGSACIGLDCLNNESFGFDTIRLKENNTRIKFEDTSTGTGFPPPDWQLTANDSASGGANKFSIEDITAATVPFTVTGSAPSNAIFVDSTGRVGFRTATPVLDLHIAKGDTPAMRLEQNNSSGYTAQTWDIAGNEANFFVRDVTGGSHLPLRIRPGAPTSSIDINASGNVGVGTASPGFKLHVVDGTAPAAARQLLELRNNGGVGLQLNDTSALSGAGSTWQIRNRNTQLQFDDTADAQIELRLDGTGNLTITGSLTTATTTYPDFVFEPSYDLMPLPALASYIADHNHLPSIPSAEEVRALGGVNMSELQVTLLQKIEELTLYALDQNRQLADLGKENALLKSRLETLEKALLSRQP